MKAVILAGGRGSRIEEETAARPKPLVEIGGQPIIWHVMNIYAAAGITDFVICAGYKGYLIKEYFSRLNLHQGDVTVDLAQGEIVYHNATPLNWKVTIADTGLETATGGRVKRIRRYLDPSQPFCLTYGDGVGNIDVRALRDFHAGHGAKVTMTTVVSPARFGAVEYDGDRITAFVEKPSAKEGRINGGFFVVDPSVLDLIGGDATAWETDTLSKLAKMGQLRGYRHDGFWQPMDTLREKMILEALWAGGKAPWKIWG
jgi:glucose-1-phosphate cytidylyltransferase